MTRTLLKWAAAGGLAAVAAAVALSPSPTPLAAAPPPAPATQVAGAAELKKVPADAAFFAHVDVAAVWDSKLGDTFRTTKGRDLERGLAEIKKTTGITPDMVKTATLFLPHLKGPGDEGTLAVLLTFRKPYDRAALVAGLKAQGNNKDKVTDKDGVITLDGGERQKLRLHAGDPTRLYVYANLPEKYEADRPADAVGPLTPAIQAAERGATAALGANLSNLPDEIRGDDVPAEVRPFQPLFRSDSVAATARLTGDRVDLEVRFRSGTKAKTLEAEKSLAAGIDLAQVALAGALKELDDPNAGEEKKQFTPLIQAAIGVFKAARVSQDGPDAVAAASVPTDLPFAPLVNNLFGGPAAASARARTQNNLKQVALAMHNYHDTYNGFPPAALVSKKGKPMLSWRVLILPFIEQDALYKEFYLDEPWDSDHNKKLLARMPTVYAVPGVTKDGATDTHVQVFTGNGAAFDPVLTTKLQNITDGTSNTLMAVLAAKAVPWTKPDDLEFDPKADPRDLLLWTENGTSVAMCDGSVRFMSKQATADTFRAVITKDGGEVVNP